MFLISSKVILVFHIISLNVQKCKHCVSCALLCKVFSLYEEQGAGHAMLFSLYTQPWYNPLWSTGLKAPTNKLTLHMLLLTAFNISKGNYSALISTLHLLPRSYNIIMCMCFSFCCCCLSYIKFFNRQIFLWVRPLWHHTNDGTRRLKGHKHMTTYHSSDFSFHLALSTHL